VCAQLGSIPRITPRINRRQNRDRDVSPAQQPTVSRQNAFGAGNGNRHDRPSASERRVKSPDLESL
jgi:hypothetical protein